MNYLLEQHIIETDQMMVEQEEYILNMYINEELSEDDILDLYKYGCLSEDSIYLLIENLNSAKKASFLKKLGKFGKILTGGTASLTSLAIPLPGTVEATLAIPAYMFGKKAIKNFKNARNRGENVYNSLKTVGKYNLLSRRLDLIKNAKLASKLVKENVPKIYNKTKEIVPKIDNNLKLMNPYHSYL